VGLVVLNGKSRPIWENFDHKNSKSGMLEKLEKIISSSDYI